MKYDFLIVGAGLYGAVFARTAADAGRRVLVIDRRPHIAGLAYSEERGGIHVHVYGPHVFHTGKQAVWDYVNRFASFNDFINSPVAEYHGKRYDLPFNMNTFRQMWGDITPEEAERIISEQKHAYGARLSSPSNLEEQAISLVGVDIYEKLIKGYSEKQWGRPCSELPASLIKRLPLRFTFDSNYYNDPYQGVPKCGYTKMVSDILDCSLIDIRLCTDYLDDKIRLDSLADRVVYTGSLDELYGYRFGRLGYRALRFETEDLDVPDYQGNAVVNFTDFSAPWTRITEHKWFNFGLDSNGSEIRQSIITKEFAFDHEAEGRCGKVSFASGEATVFSGPAYPLGDDRNLDLYAKYKSLADDDPKLIVGGRLGDYKYYDMDDVISNALADAADALQR